MKTNTIVGGMFYFSADALNRCADCNKFKEWEVLNYIEDIDFSGGVDCYHICDDCQKKELSNGN